jgi:hypothetical protein
LKIVHPLDDVAEEKLNVKGLGKLDMTGAVKWSLLALRGYLLIMIGLILFDVVHLAGLL